MNRRRFSIYFVLGFLALSVVVFSIIQTRTVQAQAVTATPTIAAGDFGLITITGKVQDVYGSTQICCEPTVGASISVSTSGPHGSSNGAAITDANGNYTVSNIHLYDTDIVTVSVIATGFSSTNSARNGVATSTNKVFNFTLMPIVPTPWITNTLGPGCGTRVVVTSTPSPTFTPTPRVATATSTSCGPIYITATPNGPTLTPTRTSTGPTPTRTRTLTPTPFSTACDTPGSCTTGTPITPTRTITLTPSATPTCGCVPACSPVSAMIVAPFTYDGAGTLCWQSANLGTYINSWNTTSVTINSVNITNLYLAAGSYPAKIGGYWYVAYNSTVAWGHFEAK